jgi:hypothetical protein
LVKLSSILLIFKATDPGDKLYGILGLMSQSLFVVHIRPEYTNVEDAFIETAISLVLDHPLSLYGRLPLLRLREEHMAGDYSPARLPSWMTDINMNSQYGKYGHFYD